jgi:hypothetical protein
VERCAETDQNMVYIILLYYAPSMSVINKKVNDSLTRGNRVTASVCFLFEPQHEGFNEQAKDTRGFNKKDMVGGWRRSIVELIWPNGFQQPIKVVREAGSHKMNCSVV